MTSASRILVVGPSWIGDMIMAQSLFMSLREQNPATHIDVLAPDWTRPLLDRMPEVSGAIGSPFKHGELRLGQRRRLGKSLRSNRYDRAIILPNSMKAALVPWFAEVPTRTGYIGEQRYRVVNDIRKLDKTELPLTVQRFVALGNDKEAAAPTHPPIPRLRPTDRAFDLTCDQFRIAPDERPILAMAPGAEFGSSKRWPEIHFVEVAKRQLQAGWQVWLFGSKNDASVTHAINAALNNACLDLAGQTRLEDAIDLLSGVDAALTNDSGLMHVCAALGLPVAAVYGSTSPGMTPPLSARARTISIDLECRPCFKRECPLGHLNCLQQLHPDLVTSALDELTVVNEN